MKKIIVAFTLFLASLGIGSGLASAQLSNCTGYANASSANNICYAGTTGLMRSWITYFDSYFHAYFTFDGPWVGPGQWSSAHTHCAGTCTVTGWGRSFSG